MMHRALALAGTLAAASPAFAADLAVLTADGMIQMVDTQTRRAAQGVRLEGIEGRIVGIDVRPADRQLYAVTEAGRVYTVDGRTGRATEKSRLATMVPAGQRVTIDFNPAADRLRLIGADGTNLRANVDDGTVATDQKLRFADADSHQGRTPNVIAGAYTNAEGRPQSTTLYDIDGTLGVFLRQAPPNDGVLNTLGRLPVEGQDVAFDIETRGETNTGWLIAGNRLHRIAIPSGQAEALGTIEGLTGAVRDLAVLPRS